MADEEKQERYKVAASTLRRIVFAVGEFVYRRVDPEQNRCIVKEIRIRGNAVRYLIGEYDGEDEYCDYELTDMPDQEILLNLTKTQE